MRGRPNHYVLNPDHSISPVEVDLDNPESLFAWARMFGSDDRQVALTVVAPGVSVSTVFLGLDHNFSERGPPLVFETMTFDDYGSTDCWRYATWDQALAGHERAVANVRALIFKDELAALAAMPDSEIDCSDIPEQIDWAGANRGNGPRNPKSGPVSNPPQSPVAGPDRSKRHK
jgi:hypothetical protein